MWGQSISVTSAAARNSCERDDDRHYEPDISILYTAVAVQSCLCLAPFFWCHAQFGFIRRMIWPAAFCYRSFSFFSSPY